MEIRHMVELLENSDDGVVTVWMRRLNKESEGLDFKEDEDRATFRGRVENAMRHAKVAAAVAVIKALGGSELSKRPTRRQAVHALALVWMNSGGL
jgi:hypothetical protein